MKKIIITIISCVAAAAVIVCCSLYFSGVISFSATEDGGVSTTPTAYVEYMDMYLILNEDGVIIKSTMSVPEDDIPQITGLTMGNIITGETLEVSSTSAFDYALRVARQLKSNYILGVDEIYVSEDEEITIYAKEIKILLGSDEDTGTKIGDLKDFYYTVVELEGTLDMQEVSASNIGYTFKVSSE